jgi:hypothetical protein
MPLSDGDPPGFYARRWWSNGTFYDLYCAYLGE